jgi:hypothetical protein
MRGFPSRDGRAGATAEPRVSLLWPPGVPPRPGPARLDARTITDLDLQEVIRALAGGDPRRERFVTALLADLCTDPAVIRYRQEVLADLLSDTELRERLEQVRGGLATLVEERGAGHRAVWSISLIARRVAELERYVDVALQLRRALEGAPTRAAALDALRAAVVALTSTPEFRSLQAELPALRATLDRAGSVTIGINLADDLMPESATVLAISAKKLEGRAPLLDRLFGQGAAHGLTALRQVEIGNPSNPLYRDLLKLLEAAVAPVADALGRYATVNAYALTELEPELHFLLSAVRLIQRLQAAGLPACPPEIAPMEERVSWLADGYNVTLALRLVAAQPRPAQGGPQSHPQPVDRPDQAKRAPQPAPAQAGATAPAGVGVVTNLMAFGAGHPRVWILTGPNRGGKTTYTRAVGQAHVLFQAGLYAPARAARLSPVNAIYTHFAGQESAEVGMGRLDEEAARLAQIFRVATPQSLILLNEVLAGTSTVEALGLATDAVRGLRLLGARAIYTTHLHELAARVDEINATTPGDAAVGSLVAGVEPNPLEGDAVIGPRHRRTFRIFPSPPLGVSYASEIAEQHGISFPQLLELFRKRGLQPEAAERHGASDAT